MLINNNNNNSKYKGKGNKINKREGGFISRMHLSPQTPNPLISLLHLYLSTPLNTQNPRTCETLNLARESEPEWCGDVDGDGRRRSGKTPNQNRNTRTLSLACRVQRRDIGGRRAARFAGWTATAVRPVKRAVDDKRRRRTSSSERRRSKTGQ